MSHSIESPSNIARQNGAVSFALDETTFGERQVLIALFAEAIELKATQVETLIPSHKLRKDTDVTAAQFKGRISSLVRKGLIAKVPNDEGLHIVTFPKSIQEALIAARWIAEIEDADRQKTQRLLIEIEEILLEGAAAA